jgi:hypothetical protein
VKKAALKDRGLFTRPKVTRYCVITICANASLSGPVA